MSKIVFGCVADIEAEQVGKQLKVDKITVASVERQRDFLLGYHQVVG